MRKKGLSRRQFISAALTGMGGFVGVGAWVASRERSSPLFFSSALTDQNSAVIYAVNAQGDGQFSLPVDQRCHAMAHPPHSPDTVFFARRPGTQAVVVTSAGERRLTFHTRENRHFYGHGCFSADGQWLFTSENDYVNGQGVIGVRDATRQYRQVDEWSSHGVGPHQLLLLGHEVVVANGGLQTHPQSGRQWLNVDSMESSLVYLDSQTGELLKRFESPAQHASIRHLAIYRDQVVVLMQYKGSQKDALMPLVGIQSGNEAIDVITPEREADWWQMRQYTASAAVDVSSGLAAVTCPYGHVVTFWNLPQRRFIKSLPIRQARGVVVHQGEFIVTGGDGRWHRIAIDRLEADSAPRRGGLKWDNHLGLIA